MKGGGGTNFRKHFGQAPYNGEQPPKGDVRARCGVAVDPGEPASRQGRRDIQSTEDCGRGHGNHRGHPVRLAGCGSTLPGAGAAQGDQWERPVEDLGVHHMAWLANMQSRREHNGASPRRPKRPVSLKIGPQIQIQNPPTTTAPPPSGPPFSSPPSPPDTQKLALISFQRGCACAAPLHSAQGKCANKISCGHVLSATTPNTKHYCCSDKDVVLARGGGGCSPRRVRCQVSVCALPLCTSSCGDPSPTLHNNRLVQQPTPGQTELLLTLLVKPRSCPMTTPWSNNMSEHV